MTINEHSYLIIGGTTKSGTTSVFNYLADHPEICASSLKETRFFLDGDYPLRAELQMERDGLEKYDTLFQRCAEKTVRMEATPDYLYSPGTAQRIYASLKDARMIFLLREPTARLISWYRYARQRDGLEQQISFQDFVEIQSRGEGPNNQAFRALEQGCYAGYLEPYYEIFGRERIFIGFLEELEAKPYAFMESLCRFAGISASFYENYQFEQFNKTETLKRPEIYQFYTRIKRAIRSYTHNQGFHIYLKQARKMFEPWFIKINRKKGANAIEITPELQAFLREYYANQNRRLELLIQRPTPWTTK